MTHITQMSTSVFSFHAWKCKKKNKFILLTQPESTGLEKNSRSQSNRLVVIFQLLYGISTMVTTIQEKSS